MKETGCTVTIHMVSSLDGIIAKKDNSVSWFDTTDNYEKGTSAPDIAEFSNSVDCYVMGSKTYEHAMDLSKNYGWPYGDIPTIVLSNRELQIDRKNIEVYAGELGKLVEERLKPNYSKVWVVGGAMLCKEFLRQKLVNEIRMVVLPIILGEGLLFFDQVGVEQTLHVKDITAYKNGMVELWYEINK